MSKRRKIVKDAKSKTQTVNELILKTNERNSFECSPERLCISDGLNIISIPKPEPNSRSVSPTIELDSSCEINQHTSYSSIHHMPQQKDSISRARSRSPSEPESYHQRLDSFDRRLVRIEVTINKMFGLINNMNQHILGKTFQPTTIIPVRTKEPVISCPKGFNPPSFPIKSLDEMEKLHNDLKNKNFFVFLVAREKEFCTPGAATETATINLYLKRFIEISLRASINLKEGNKTIQSNFPQVYDFLIAVMKKGFKAHQRELKVMDAEKALRSVWSRSKQTLDRMKHAKKR